MGFCCAVLAQVARLYVTEPAFRLPRQRRRRAGCGGNPAGGHYRGYRRSVPTVANKAISAP